MDQLGLGFLNAFGLPQIEFVELAADLGCRYMSTVVRGGELLPLGYPLGRLLQVVHMDRVETPSSASAWKSWAAANSSKSCDVNRRGD